MSLGRARIFARNLGAFAHRNVEIGLPQQGVLREGMKGQRERQDKPARPKAHQALEEVVLQERAHGFDHNGGEPRLLLELPVLRATLCVVDLLFQQVHHGVVAVMEQSVAQSSRSAFVERRHMNPVRIGPMHVAPTQQSFLRGPEPDGPGPVRRENVFLWNMEGMGGGPRVQERGNFMTQPRECRFVCVNNENPFPLGLRCHPPSVSSKGVERAAKWANLASSGTFLKEFPRSVFRTVVHHHHFVTEWLDGIEAVLDGAQTVLGHDTTAQSHTSNA